MGDGWGKTTSSRQHRLTCIDCYIYVVGSYNYVGDLSDCASNEWIVRALRALTADARAGAALTLTNQPIAKG